MKARLLTAVLLCSLAVFAAALHAPGEMSVDSILALYGAMKHTAIGWDVTYQSAILAWLGGGLIAASLFVAINCCLTYGCFIALLSFRIRSKVPNWRYVLALIVAINPLFMFYVGIVWKDVLLASLAMASATLLLLATEKHGFKRHVLLAMAAIIAAFFIPLRQQAFLLAFPLIIASALMSTTAQTRAVLARAAIVVFAVGVCLGFAILFTALQRKTIASPNSRQVAQGLITVRDYDIAGMIADSPIVDSSSWAEATPEVVAEIRKFYSSERIDTIWHNPVIRGYLDGLGNADGWRIWVNGIKHNPTAYLTHRVDSLSYLLGVRSIVGCVPAYWGVYGLPDQMAALNINESMDERAKFVGRMATRLYPTPIFRNWFYALILLLVTLALFRWKAEHKGTVTLVAVGGWLYTASYFPTTIACDFRYLYPTAGLASILAIFMLTSVSSSELRAGERDST